jgi:excinuclease UvrABC helicase subunit UvrB
MGTPISADYSTVELEAPEAEELFEDLDALEGEVERLEKEMLRAAELLEFEKAAEYRDRIRYLRERAVLA